MAARETLLGFSVASLEKIHNKSSQSSLQVPFTEMDEGDIIIEYMDKINQYEHLHFIIGKIKEVLRIEKEDYD